MNDRLYFALLWTLGGLFGLLAAGGFNVTAGPLAERLWRALVNLFRIASTPFALGLRALGLHLTWRIVAAIVLAAAAFARGANVRPWPGPGTNPLLDLIAAADPLGYRALQAWYMAVPGLAAFGGFMAVTGARALPATRVYLKPHYLERELPYWRARETGKL